MGEGGARWERGRVWLAAAGGRHNQKKVEAAEMNKIRAPDVKKVKWTLNSPKENPRYIKNRRQPVLADHPNIFAY